MLKEALSRMANVFSPINLLRGQEYQQKEHVLNIRLSDGLLKARVKGRSSQIFDVHIDLRHFPEKPALCSCPYKINCEHAAASLLNLLHREKYDIKAPQSSKSELSLIAWLESLQDQDGEPQKVDKKEEVLYLLQPNFSKYANRVYVDLAFVKRLKSGKLSKKNKLNLLTKAKIQNLNEEDRDIVTGLIGKKDSNDGLSFVLRESSLLEKILKREHVFLKEEDEILHLGDEIKATLHWKLNQDGKQNLVLINEEGIEIKPLLLDKTWYFDEDEYELGPLNTSYNLDELHYFLNGGLFDFIKAKDFYEEQLSQYPAFPKPRFAKEKKELAIKPLPLIIFDMLETTDSPFLLTAELAFIYKGVTVKAKDEVASLFYENDSELLELKRNFDDEAKIKAKLDELVRFRSPNEDEIEKALYDIKNELILADYPTISALKELYQGLVPELRGQSFQIQFAHPLFEEPINADELEWYSQIDEGNNFFSYQLGIFIEGKEINMVPLILELIKRVGRESLDALQDDEQVRLPLMDGKALYISMKRIKPLLRFLLEYGLRQVEKDKPLHLTPYQLILMKETEEAFLSIQRRWPSYENFKKKLDKLVHLKELPAIDPPLGLQTNLRDYQLQGIAWLQFLREVGLGGILADDMGLGKTVQTLAHLQLEKEKGRLTKACLILSPTSLIGNWFEEAKRFTPDLRVLVFHGLDRHQDDFENYDVILSTYGLIQRDKSRFIENSFYYLILDEAQSIKNARTNTTQIIHQLKAEHRLCLSGTPLENHLGELWSLFHFLMPGLLSDSKTFKQIFRNPIEKFNEVDKKELLAKRIKPFMLRRCKAEVIKELPPKTETRLSVELNDNQRDIYEVIRISMEKKVREAIEKQGMGKSHIVLLDALLKLRQICCDPRLLPMPEAKIAHGSSAKLTVLMELLDNLMEEKRSVLVFSQFTSMLKLIEEELNKRHYPYLKLTGQTQNRQALVHQFQQGAAPIFLISLKAGGTGLNLTQADTVIHYDPWWNPAVEEQATDRSHRIGQKNPVFVYKLITTGTVEEVILKMQDKKRSLFEGVLADNAETLVGLTSSDIEQFFKPLNSM
ncbi:MAG: DEAD/DEAH box helicase [Proteobacteria bacterium]|nr:DEAD/DEAH box helicase [Pseudomonadota bacterium]